jgi:hypothetical protein
MSCVCLSCVMSCVSSCASVHVRWIRILWVNVNGGDEREGERGQEGETQREADST